MVKRDLAQRREPAGSNKESNEEVGEEAMLDAGLPDLVQRRSQARRGKARRGRTWQGGCRGSRRLARATGGELDVREAKNGQRSMLPSRSSQNRGGARGNDGGGLKLRRWRWFAVRKRNKTRGMVREEQHDGEKEGDGAEERRCDLGISPARHEREAGDEGAARVGRRRWLQGRGARAPSAGSRRKGT